MRIILDHLYQDLVGPLVQDLWCRDPVGPLVQDVCIRILSTACVGILWDHLCKISVCSSTSARSCSGSLCGDPLDHLYQDPAGALVQDPCYEDTCARSPYQDLVGSLLSGSCRTTSARSLSDPFGPLYQDPVGQLVQDLCLRISV